MTSRFLKLFKLGLIKSISERKFYLVWSLGLLLVYLSLTPGLIAGMGYMGENLQAADQIAAHMIGWGAGQSDPAPVSWPRHGAVEMIFEVPLMLVKRILFGADPLWADRALALQPVLLTALLGAIILKWSSRLTGSLKQGYAVALSAAFATMLWPYAYIGLETTQSLFLALAGYLALDYERAPAWPRTFAFAAAAGVAASAKSNGLFLLPAIGFLALCYFWRDWRNPAAIFGELKRHWLKAVCLVSIIGLFLGMGVYSRSLYWSRQGQGFATFVTRDLLAESPSMFLLNLWSQLFSINKGLIFFAPIAVIGLFASRRAYRAAPQLAVFAWLVLAGTAGSLSLLVPWEDEVWGPRYLHSAVAPLIVCLAGARRGRSLSLRRDWPLGGLAALGLAVSLLGSVFPYGALHRAAMEAGCSTLENLLYDPRFNHPHFNLKLLRIWLSSGDEQWPAPPHWWFERPPDAPPWRAVNLRDHARPHSALLLLFKVSRLAKCLAVVLLAGLALLAWSGLMAKELEE